MPMDSIRAGRSLVLAALRFSVQALFARLAGVLVPSIEIVLVRSVVSLILTVAVLRRIHIASWWGTHRILLVLRGAFGFGALSCFFYSVTHLPLAEATVIQFTNPIFTALLAGLLLGERMTAREGVAITLGLTGMLLITRPAVLFAGEASTLPPEVVLIGLAGAFLTSCVYVLLRRVTATEHELVIVLYFPLVGVPASLALAVPVWVWPSAWEWLLLIVVGIAAQVGQIYLTRGMKHTKAASASVILYLQVVFATCWGLVVLSERPDIWTVGGSLLVLGGTVIASRRPRLPT